MREWKNALMVATKDGLLGPFFLDLDDVFELLPFAADDDSLPFEDDACVERNTSWMERKKKKQTRGGGSVTG